jgi:hypothetical protein
MNNSIRQLIINPIIVAVAFWGTDGLLSFPEMFFISSKAWIITKSICLPVLTIVALFIIANKWTRTRRDIIISGFMALFWIWFSSGFYLLVMSAFSETGIMSLQGLGWLLLVFPLTAIEVSSYSGGIFGLIATSVALPIAAITIKKKGSFNNKIEATGNIL